MGQKYAGESWGGGGDGGIKVSLNSEQQKEAEDQDDIGRFIQEKDLWFEDGSIILEIKGHIFKVYLSFLKQHSAFFRDIALGKENCNGVKIFHLPSSWSYEDVKNVLTVLFYPNWFHVNIRDPEAHDFLASLLLMSHGLKIPKLEAHTLHKLKQSYPDSYPVKQFTQPSTTEILHVIKAARATNNQSLLPMAFYYLSCLSMTDLMAFSDISLSDDLPSKTGAESQLKAGESSSSFKSAISGKDLKNCLVGRETLIKLHREQIWKVAKSRAMVMRKCRNYCSHFLEDLEVSPDLCDLLHLPSVFYGIEDIFDKAQDDSDILLCDKCDALFWDAVDCAREAVWNQLPEIFGLQKWPMLHRQTGR